MDPPCQRAHTAKVDPPTCPAPSTTMIPSGVTCPWPSIRRRFTLRRLSKRQSLESRSREGKRRHHLRKRRISRRETTLVRMGGCRRSPLRGMHPSRIRDQMQRAMHLPARYPQNENQIGIARSASPSPVRTFYIKRRVEAGSRHLAITHLRMDRRRHRLSFRIHGTNRASPRQPMASLQASRRISGYKMCQNREE